MLVKNLATHFCFRGDRERSNVRWEFVSDSQEVDAIKELLGPSASRFDSFFVIVGEGVYSAAYGMEGIIPAMWKRLVRLA